MPVEVSVGPINPAEAVLPLFGLDDSNNIQRFLGTGFFVGEEPVFVTADHNVEAWDGSFGVVKLPDLKHFYPASVAHRDGPNDVAIFAVEGYRPSKRFMLAPNEAITQNQMVVCCEYGTTVQLGNEIVLSVATRVGNVTRMLGSLEVLGRDLTEALELSSPALRGSSGAPILSSEGFLVWGMVVANVSYHLLPVQIETVADPQGQITEETKFMMPQAVAVNVKHIRAAIDKIQSPSD